MRGVLLSFLLVLGAGLVASYFHSPQLRPVLQVLAAVFLLDGGTNIGLVFFKKELDFRKYVTNEVVADIASMIVALGLALWVRNVWALVAGSISFALARCVGSYCVHPFRPRLRWDWPAAADLLHFGKHIFWITIATFIVTSGDDAIVGKLLGLTALGFYSMAYNMANLPVTSLAAVVGKVSFAAFSRLQDDREALKRTFGQAFEATLMLLLPVAAMLFLLAHDFTVVLLGEKWLPMVPVLRVLCFLGLFRGLSNVFAAVHLAVNRPAVQTRNKAVELVAFLLLVYPCTMKWGLLGAGFAVTIVYGISALLNGIDTARILRTVWSVLAYPALVPLAILAAQGASVLAVHRLIPPHMAQWRLAAEVCAACGVYAVLAVPLRKGLLLGIVRGIGLGSETRRQH
jgi:O-antigen/teichoic acid export membrane protein